MPVMVVGLNHRTAPIAVLEHVLEAVVLSTCNRMEVAASVTKFHGGAQDLRNFISEFCHVAPEEFSDLLYTYHEESAVRHLFRVASGIDSLVVGESEILGQMKRAFAVASEERVAGRLLGQAFRQGLRVGKRARSETDVGRNPVSVSSAAVELARRAFPSRSLAGKRVLVVGAGKMGHLAVQSLSRAGARDVVVMSRTEDRAREVAADAGIHSRALGDLAPAVAQSDIVICSTTSTATILDKPVVAAAAARRPASDPLLIVDIAVPRDVDPACAEVPGVVVRDIYDLRGVVEANVGVRIAEVSKVEQIIAEEVKRFVAWERATEIAPAIAQLLERADDVRRAELSRVQAQLAELSPAQKEAVERVTKRIVRKLLHRPLDVARELAGSKQGHVYLQALRELFELEDEPGP
jgi:glutamyl-tRNA reductase